jgi:hypothetical protein
MLRHIRVATEAEIERAKNGSDMGGEPFAVYAFDNKAGEADLAVVKNVIEVDPVFYAPSTNDVQKVRFQWGIEERLMGAGVFRYACNVRAVDERWRRILREWGFQEQSSEPEIRMVRNLK